MGIERFIWADHVELRLGQRGLTKFDVEEAVRDGHRMREANRGDADWRVSGVRLDSRAVRVVGAWPLRKERRR